MKSNLNFKAVLIFIFIILNSAVIFGKGWVSVYAVKANDYQYDFFADNTNYCPYQLSLKMDIQSNKQSTTADIPLYTIIKAQQRGRYLFSITSKTKWTSEPEFKYETFIGDPSEVKIDENYLYFIPFQENHEFRVAQGYKNRFSHNGWTRYSIDFGMPIGTPVCAARDGIVVDVKVDNWRGGGRRWYRDFVNYITLYHKDGTYSQYVHLNKNGTAVKVGDHVRPGQVIGYSGNTGWTRGPHLHFMAFKPIYEGKDTFPTRFMGSDGNPVTIRNYHYYSSYRYIPSGLLTKKQSLAHQTNIVESVSEDTNIGSPE